MPSAATTKEEEVSLLPPWPSLLTQSCRGRSSLFQCSGAVQDVSSYHCWLRAVVDAVHWCSAVMQCRPCNYNCWLRAVADELHWCSAVVQCRPWAAITLDLSCRGRTTLMQCRPWSAITLNLELSWTQYIDAISMNVCSRSPMFTTVAHLNYVPACYWLGI